MLKAVWLHKTDVPNTLTETTVKFDRPVGSTITRRQLLSGAAAGAFAMIATPMSGFAQTSFPSRPIRWICPFAVGGGSDILARLLAREIEKDLGQPVIVDNKPGGNTVIAVQALLQAPADGHTLMSVGVDTLVTNPLIYKMPYDPGRDFSLVATMARFPHVLVARKDFPGATPREMIEAIKTSPRPVSYATFGTGSTSHLSMELLLQRLGAKGTPIPYKGSAPALTDLIGGQIDLFMADAASAQQHVRNGAVKPVGIPSRERYQALQDVPTLSEAGVPGFDLLLWQGVMMRAGTPTAFVERVSASFNKALSDPSVAAVLAERGFQPLYRTPAEFREFVKAGDASFGAIIRQQGIRAE
jgi:tripartite-type tricarboxylate transporter receptor subunit TctC